MQPDQRSPPDRQHAQPDTSLRWVKVWALPGQRPAYYSSQKKGFLYSHYILERGLAETPLLDPLRQSAGYSWHHLKTFEPKGQNGELLFGEMGPR